MSDYTPTTEEVRDAATAYWAMDEDEFDRWYASEIAKAERRGAEHAAQRIISRCISEHDVAGGEGLREGHTWNSDTVCEFCEVCVAAARGEDNGHDA